MGNTQKYHFRQEWNLAFESKLYILCVTSMNFFVLLLASILTVQSKKTQNQLFIFLLMLWWVVNLYVMFGEKEWNEGEWRSSYTLGTWGWEKIRRKWFRKSICLLLVGYCWGIGGGLRIWSLRESSRKLIVCMNQGLASFQPEKQCLGLIQPSTRMRMMCKTKKSKCSTHWDGGSGKEI